MDNSDQVSDKELQTSESYVSVQRDHESFVSVGFTWADSPTWQFLYVFYGNLKCNNIARKIKETYL